MKKFIVILAFLFSGLILEAQSIYNHWAVMSGGQTVSAGGYYMVSAVAELAVREVSQSGYHISEGFINPDIIGSMSVSPEQMLAGVNIYPNPVGNELFISLEKLSDYRVTIYDMTGKTVFSSRFSDTQHKMTLSGLSEATYMLVITDEKTGKTKIFKLSKK